ncbi:MAG: TldD/PmbA family protein [Actinobacteria bacterium]|nr:TldD/PmbA family protein [Actinomycetota bacterium]MBI3687318.1 TldD/PmbA family protein [Actinomycetota bacterium]
MLSPQETVERALSLSVADGCVVLVTDRTETNLRWANNTLTTNGEMRSRRVAVLSLVKGAVGTSVGVLERSAVTPDALRALVENSERAARQASPAEDAMPLVAPAGHRASSAGWDGPPAETSVGVFAELAPALGEAFGAARGDGRLLFGFAEHVVESTYLGSSTGLRLRHDQPTGRVEMNAKSPDFGRSVWTGAATRDFADVDVAGLDARLARRLGWAANRIELPAGRYETILPPTAVADLMIYMYWMANARDADEGRTVFSRRGGGSRIGDRLAELPLRLASDPVAEGLACAPFLSTTTSGSAQSVFDNGLTVSPVNWIDDGVLSNLIRTRSWAQRTGTAPVAPVGNLVLTAPGATATEADLVSRTGRGLLLTCLWYIRVVDPRTLLLTGLTRDGVYLVEGGEVVGAVNNFRFNESPVGLLGRISEVSRTEITLPREWGDDFHRTAMPAVRVPDFNMSTVSQGV